MQEVKRRLQIFLILFLLITVTGTLGFMILEDVSLTDAFYYNIVTMSTVGYGDIHPTSQAGRMFAVLLIILGGGTFLGVIANLTEIFILRREISNREKKVNMVLGVFFNEVGVKLLKDFSAIDSDIEKIRKMLLIGSDIKDNRFPKIIRELKKYRPTLNASELNLSELNSFLESKKNFLLNLLENPAFVEHENFSDALLSVFHIQDELACRSNLISPVEADIAHISIDINRAYSMLIEQWVLYMRHLKKEYPFLFSLAMRKNPFDPDATPAFR